MKYVFLTAILLLCTAFESTFISLPLSLIVLLIFTIFWQDEVVFLFAISSGFIVDALLFRSLGSTGIFYVLFLGLVLLYRQKFEIQTFPFALVFSLVGCLGYLLFFGSTNLFFQLLLCGIFTGGCYFFTHFLLFKKRTKDILQ